LIKRGIYIIDKEYCKIETKLSKNNKTDKLISKIEVYHMLSDCINKKNFIELPNISETKYEFDILNCLTKINELKL